MIFVHKPISVKKSGLPTLAPLSYIKIFALPTNKRLIHDQAQPVMNRRYILEHRKSVLR